MTFETKYNLGDWVVVILKTNVELPPVTCTACEGTGAVRLREGEYFCPKCAGKKTTQEKGWGWVISNSGTIGHVRTAHGIGADRDEDEDAVSTMVEYFFNTHGSGSIYREDQLWPTRDEAQAECDRRNS